MGHLIARARRPLCPALEQQSSPGVTQAGHSPTTDET